FLLLFFEYQTPLAAAVLTLFGNLISRISFPRCPVNRRTSRIDSPPVQLRKSSTVRLSTRREDCVPEQVESWKSRALPSKYRIVLEVDASHPIRLCRG